MWIEEICSYYHNAYNNLHSITYNLNRPKKGLFNDIEFMFDISYYWVTQNDTAT